MGNRPKAAKWCPEARAWALDGRVYPDADWPEGDCVYWDGRKCIKMLRVSCKSEEKPLLTEERR